MDGSVGKGPGGLLDGLDGDKVVNCAMSVQGLPPALLGFLLLLVAARGFTQDDKTTELDERFEDDNGLGSGPSGIGWTSCSWLYNLRGPTENSCKDRVYQLPLYLDFEVNTTPSTLRTLRNSLFFRLFMYYHCCYPCLAYLSLCTCLFTRCVRFWSRL